MPKQEGKCEHKPKKSTWTANLAGNSTTLGDNLKNKPDAATAADITASDWPSQAHHLIPHLQLKAHAVAKWLKKSSIIFEDTKYNVDHKKNGKWMPYASKLPEWKKYSAKKKRDLMFLLMRVSGIQLHQGRHSRKNKYGIGVAAYKARVAEYLDKIRNRSAAHVKGPPKCKPCDGKKDGDKYPARHNTVTYVDNASRLLDGDIKECRIFVSRIAAEFAETEGF